MTDDKFLKAFDRAIERSRFRQQRQAVLGKGDADKTLYVSDRTGFIWARFQFPGDSTPMQVRSYSITPAYGAPVLIQKSHDGIWEVIGSDGTAIIEYAGGSGYTPNSPLHAITHQYYGADPIRLDARQMQPLLVRPADTPGLSLYVEPGVYYNASGTLTAWEGGTIDLTSKVPGTAGYQRIIIVGIDTQTDTLTTADGTATFYSLSSSIYVPFTLSDAVAVTQQSDFIGLAAYRLYYGQTRIDWWDFFADMRVWIGANPSISISVGPIENLASVNIRNLSGDIIQNL